MVSNALVRAGINFVDDAVRLARGAKNLKPCYDTARKLVQVRPGFVAMAAEDAQAVNRSGRLLNGYVRNAVHPETGMTERIFYSGSDVQRVVYDANKKPLGAISVEFRGPNRSTCHHRVFVPSESGELLEITETGAKKASDYCGIKDFAKAFDIKDIQAFFKDFFKF